MKICLVESVGPEYIKVFKFFGMGETMFKKSLLAGVVGFSLLAAASANADTHSPIYKICPPAPPSCLPHSVPEIGISGFGEIACLVVGGMIVMSPRRGRKIAQV
jgi:hypothetical protein